MIGRRLLVLLLLWAVGVFGVWVGVTLYFRAFAQ